MRHSTLAVALAALAAPAAAEAQAASPAPVITPGNALLTLTAEGRSTRQPDLAVFSAGVASSGKTAGEALAANSADMGRVIAALRRGGIAERDIQTSNLSLNPVYAQPRRLPDGSYENETPRIIGYQANNTVSVRQRKLEDFGRVIDTLVSAGANQVNGPSFQLDSPEAAMDEARTEAMRKARERANLYARASGLKVLRILSISESGGYSPPVPMYRMEAAAPAGAPPPVAAGELAIEANVTVTFELAP